MENKIKELENELKYLIEKERKREIELNQEKLNNADCDIKELAREIYTNRGIDINKIKTNGLFSDLINSMNDMSSLFKNKDQKIKNKMIIEIVYIVIILLLLKIPFDLVRDIGYEYIELISTNSIISTIWNIIFLLIYTITLICSFIAFIKNFNNKYKNTSI